VFISGQIFSREDLYLNGEVEGTIEMLEHCLTVGPEGKLHTRIKARDVVVHGAISGNVDATQTIAICKGAGMLGDIRAARVRIDDGAYFQGSIEIVRAERRNEQPSKRMNSAVTRAAAMSAGGGRR
jgi:cytoskeletal protein CcmA (bactofilin family)